MQLTSSSSNGARARGHTLSYRENDTRAYTRLLNVHTSSENREPLCNSCLLLALLSDVLHVQ